MHGFQGRYGQRTLGFQGYAAMTGYGDAAFDTWAASVTNVGGGPTVKPQPRPKTKPKFKLTGDIFASWLKVGLDAAQDSGLINLPNAGTGTGAGPSADGFVPPVPERPRKKPVSPWLIGGALLGVAAIVGGGVYATRQRR